MNVYPDRTRLVYIYALCDPRTEQVRYVGKTTQKLSARYGRHLSDKRKDRRVCWIKSLTNIGLKPFMKVLQVADNENWEALEKFWIAKMRQEGCNLVNATDGGEGALGAKHTEETRKKISAARTGVGLTEAHRKSMSECRKGRSRNPHSEETKQKIREVAIGRKHTEETKQKISLTKIAEPHKPRTWQIGRKHKPETIEKIRQKLKTRPPITEETRQKLSNVAKARTEETKNRISAAAKARPWSPETIARMNEAKRVKREASLKAEQEQGGM